MRLRMPAIAAINGVAAGAGASIAMACDIAIAHPQASFIQAFSKIGLIPDAGGSWLLVERLGLARALALAMTGDKLMAPQARDCLGAAMAMAEKLAVMPTAALVATRHLLRDASTRTLDQHLDIERDTQSMLGRSHDYFEGVSAFLEKRQPKFKGE
jgi:2-(1,2-epoxy-1,2-dihydrophenyl)acetyl-CoA isomerase